MMHPGPMAQLMGAVLEAQDRGQMLCQNQRRVMRWWLAGLAEGIDWVAWATAYQAQLDVMRLGGAMMACLPASNDSAKAQERGP